MAQYHELLITGADPQDSIRNEFQTAGQMAVKDLRRVVGEWRCGPGSLVLMCWARDAELSNLHFNEIKNTGADIIIQIADEALFSLDILVDHLDCPAVAHKSQSCGLRYAFRAQTIQSARPYVTDRMRNVLRGASPFGPFQWTLAGGVPAMQKPKRIFLSRPDENKTFAQIPWIKKRLGVHFEDPMTSGGGGVVGPSVRRGIDSSDAMIAYLGQKFPRDGDKDLVSYNACVMYEIGYADKAGKPVVIFGDPGDVQRAPSNLGGRIVESYYDVLDLIQRVYYGIA